MDDLIQEWKLDGCDSLETVRRLIDMFFVSVLPIFLRVLRI